MVVTEEGKYLSVHIIVPKNTHKKTSHATNIKLLVNSLIKAHFPKPKYQSRSIEYNFNLKRFQNIVPRFLTAFFSKMCFFF